MIPNRILRRKNKNRTRLINLICIRIRQILQVIARQLIVLIKMITKLFKMTLQIKL